MTIHRWFVVLTAMPLACLAQQPPAAPGGRGGGRGPVPPSNVRTNEQNGVHIDRFIGNPINSPAHLSHGGLVTHTILSAGNPYEPGEPGAVLEYRKDLSTATLPPHTATQLATVPDAILFYVKGGEGRLDDGRQMWDLHAEIAVLVAPDTSHRLTNTSDKPLQMIMLKWTPAAPLKNPILVRDVNRLPWCEEAVHWNNASRCVFGRNDGMMESERVLVVYLEPWATSQPHTHPPGFEEIWTKLSPGTSVTLMGSELRKFPENAAYRVPPNGITEHSNLNLTEDHVDQFLYVARDRSRSESLVTGVGTPGGIAASATPPPGPLPSFTATLQAAPGGRGNMNVVRDQSNFAAVQVADVPGRPLK
jgi:quercetin dioxygenase-like cupin family protein